MNRNVNPWVVELLSWHGHDRGGVRVPFHTTMGKPLKDVIDTSLIKRLRQLALDLVNGTSGTPRWIFLIGGPGNGKSEAVEAFVRELDSLTDSQDALINVVAEKFAPNPVVPRRINVTDDEFQGEVLREKIRRLIIIQDASAVDGPDEIAENSLIEDLADLITCPVGNEPVFICCANRGLIARARSTIEGKELLDWLNVPEVTKLLTQLLTATGLGPGALAFDRPQCWPLEHDKRFAAWPLDLDSIIATNSDISPFEQMIATATDNQKWNVANCCSGCNSKELCPFYANAEMLRGDDARKNLLTLLRHSEIATGQRWNFRDAFSLCAELIVGQRDDFGTIDEVDAPCLWVHERADEISFGTQLSNSLSAAWSLGFHLYSQALFPVWIDPIEELHAETVAQSELTQAAINVFSRRQRSQGVQIRRLLAGAFSQKLDPALATPPNSNSVLRQVEDEFGQSVKQGSEAFQQQQMLIPLVVRQLELMALAEANWNDAVRDSRRIRSILESLRVVCSILVKRFLGVRDGEYLNVEYLVEYDAVFDDPQKLWEAVQPLRSILAPGEVLGGSLVRVFGQPPTDASKDIVVTHPLGNVVPRVASQSTAERPGHDMPWVEVEGHHIPLTFDLFAALRANSLGAQFASFAPHTRAAIDRVKNAIAGGLARDKEGLLGRGVSIKIGTLGKLSPTIDGTFKFDENG